MKAPRLIYYLICLLVLLQSCHSAKKLIKTADAFAAKGNYDEAANYYYNALLKNTHSQQAMIGLRSNGQLVLNEKFTAFSRLVLEQKIEEAIKQYEYAAKYAGNAAQVGVKLSWAYEYDEVFEDIKQEYLESLFSDALRLIEQKKYDVAEKQFERMAAYDSTYNHVSVLRLNTVLEPLYAKALKQMAAGNYADAFRTFSRLCQIDEGFKDVRQRKEEAAAKATTKVGLLPVQNKTKQDTITHNFDALLAQKIKSVSAFIHIITADELQPVLQKRGFTFLYDDTTVWQASRSLSLRYALHVVIEEYADTSGSTEKEPRIAYEAVTENVPNPYTGTYTYITKFKKITYLDSHTYNKVCAKIRYQLIDLNTGKQLLGEILELEKEDSRHAYVYDGKINNLYERLPQDNQMPPPNQDWRERFYHQHHALLTHAELYKELQMEAASTIQRRVSNLLR